MFRRKQAKANLEDLLYIVVRSTVIFATYVDDDFSTSSFLVGPRSPDQFKGSRCVFEKKKTVAQACVIADLISWDWNFVFAY